MLLFDPRAFGFTRTFAVSPHPRTHFALPCDLPTHAFVSHTVAGDITHTTAAPAAAGSMDVTHTTTYVPRHHLPTPLLPHHLPIPWVLDAARHGLPSVNDIILYTGWQMESAAVISFTPPGEPFRRRLDGTTRLRQRHTPHHTHTHCTHAHCTHLAALVPWTGGWTLRNIFTF